eukprot:NODE_398_length_9374_cov_0.508895.p4 type:complete len:235 gc:universal NODE_398_length_9374_cov_0.508895:1631-2335(+)
MEHRINSFSFSIRFYSSISQLFEMLEIWDEFLEQWYLLDLDALGVNVVYPFSVFIHAIQLLPVKLNKADSQIYSDVWGSAFTLVMNLHFTLKIMVLILSSFNTYSVFHQFKQYNVLYPMNTVIESRISSSNTEYILSVWEPRQVLLQCMICINPLHSIIHFSDIHWYYKFLFIGLSVFFQNLVVQNFKQLIKDKQTLYELVMQEYNVKMVYPMQQILNEEEYSLLESPISKKQK